MTKYWRGGFDYYRKGKYNKAMEQQQKEFYTTKEVAIEVKLSPRRIRQLVQSGELRSVKFGRDLMIPASEVKRFKAGRQDQ